MLSALRKYEVWVFLVMIILVNGLFVSGIGLEILPKGLYQNGRFALLAGMLGGIVIVVRGWAGIGDLLRPMLEWRRPVRGYAFAPLWNPMICLAILAAIYALNRNAMPDFAPNFAIAARPSVMKTVLISSIIGEIVWISYAIRRLSGQFTPYVSAMIVGAVWTAWWVPMAIYNIGIIPNLPLGGLLINQIGVAAICTFVYMHTKSGFLVLCLHDVQHHDSGVAVDAECRWCHHLLGLCHHLFHSGFIAVVFGPKPLFRTAPARQSIRA